MGPEDRRPVHRCNAVRLDGAGPFLFPGGGWFLGRLIVREVVEVLGFCGACVGYGALGPQAVAL